MPPSGWNYYKDITVSDTNVDGNLTNFPLLVVISADSDIGARCDADGHCLRFTVDPHGDSELLDYERQSWSGGGGGAATGKFWVEVPSILATGGATVRCWYDNSAAADGANITGTWNSDFKAVYHLEEASGGPYLDATSNSHDSSAGTMPDQGTGRIDNCQNFAAASSEYIDVTHSTDFRFDGDATISLWAQVASYKANDLYCLFSKQGPDGADREWDVHCDMNFEGTAFGFKSEVWTDGGPWLGAGESDGTRAINTWFHVGVRFDQTADELYTYVNGVQVASGTTTSGTQNVAGTAVQQIGSRESGAKFFDGDIDEVRFSDMDQGVPWLKFEYHNMTSTYETSWGSEESGATTHECAGTVASAATTTSVLVSSNVQSGAVSSVGAVVGVPNIAKKLSGSVAVQSSTASQLVRNYSLGVTSAGVAHFSAISGSLYGGADVMGGSSIMTMEMGLT